jgi:hypothetical protein
MTKKIFYEKQGRKYVPIAEYDNDFLDSFPKGDTLVMCYPGGSSRKYNVDANYAAMIAAGRVAEDAMCKAITKAAELRPQRALITVEQKEAWEALARAFGDDLCTLQGNSVHDVAEAGVLAMQEEADKLMLHPAVQKAYDNFQIVCKLVSESERQGVK